MAERKKNQVDSQEIERFQVRKKRFVKEIVGIFLGLSAALMISALMPAIRETYSLGIVVLWGGATGGLLASYERFEQAGAALTRRENRVLNTVIGLGVPLLILLGLYFYNR